MLGLADRGRIRRILELALSGDAAGTLTELDEAHLLGMDPSSLIRGLMQELHAATRAKAGGGADLLQPTEQRQAAEDLAGKLGWGQIHRLWQLLLKGLVDVQVAPDPNEAATMALLRIIHAADLPDPSTLLSRLASGEGAVAAPARQAAPASTAASMASLPPDFRGFVTMLGDSGKRILAQQLHDQVGVVRYAPPELVLKPMKPLGSEWPRDLAATLKSLTGTSWRVSISDEPSEPSLRDQDAMAEERARADVLADPNVRAVLDAFPGAELESYASTKG
jgi:DNA polymerase-3 subunit gamma/tau